MSRAQGVLLLVLVLFSCVARAGAADPPNVLFIAVDDLRPELSCYGSTHMKTPNLDQLAAEGTLFRRAYCMVPTCGASRASLMTGIRPRRDRFVNYLAWAEKDAPGIKTLNTHFRENGYTTISNGKVFHHPTDNAEGWSEPAWRPKNVPAYRRPENATLAAQRARELGSRGRGPAYESADVDDEDYADGRIAKKTVADLKRLKAAGKPFFLAAGFMKPHLPFVAPRKYWDLYDPEKIALPENYHVPENAPNEAIHSFGELRAYAGIPSKGPLSDEAARNLIHGYYACVSYTDAQIGRLLKGLIELDLHKNTIVVVWGDHGWNLGDHTLWCKHSCFESSMQVPLIMKTPGMKPGQTTNCLVELIDLYPTLSELCGLAVPEHLQGTSFVPVLKQPDIAGKSAAVGRYQSGDTIRTDRFRFTEYTKPNGMPTARMLYDQTSDPLENRNISEEGDLQSRIEELTQELRRVKYSTAN